MVIGGKNKIISVPLWIRLSKMSLHGVQNGDRQLKMENGKLKMKNTKHYAQ